MTSSNSNTRSPDRQRSIRDEDSVKLSRAILHCANRGLPRVGFLREVSQLLLDFSACDGIEVWLNHGELYYRWEATRRPEKADRFELIRWVLDQDGKVTPVSPTGSDLERLCRDVACQRFDPTLPFFTSNGSFWTGNAWEQLPADGGTGPGVSGERLCIGGHHRSLAVIRFLVGGQAAGLLHMKCERPHCFTEEEVELYEGVAQTLGLAVADWQAEAALRERVKELTCLYGIARVVERAGNSKDKVLQDIVELLPPAWQYPEITAARIVLDGHSHATPSYRRGPHWQTADIVVNGEPRGSVEVTYLEERAEFAIGAFLQDEEKLINAVAREVALIVERREADEQKSKLEQQLIHADRLATIGELAAGVAHELNEPLGSILGFAQLAEKCPDLPGQAGQDVRKIIAASLYAREVIKKLMVFARQMPSRKARINLNGVVEEAFFFLEGRCVKGGIEVVRSLAPNLPEIIADPAQVKQILVNLVVNAIQAMPEGGTLAVGTQAKDASVSLIVEDSGIGMSEETIEKVFLPFFTTKDVNEGTGLGLAVVHGIVVSHGGSIDIESQPGRGARFEVCLPILAPEETQEVD